MSIRTYWICKLATVLKFGSESSVQLFQRLKIRIYRRHSEFLSNSRIEPTHPQGKSSE
jgi:hypothetical protein